MSGFFEEVERDPEACMPDILLVYEVYTERRATLLYPINLLRNMARLQVLWLLTQAAHVFARKICM